MRWFATPGWFWRTTRRGVASAAPGIPVVQAPEAAADDEAFATCLRRLQTLNRSWPGEPLGEEGLLRLLNPAGTRPPLFWCFNAAQEFSGMAAMLGPDQPLVGMRSLNLIAQAGPERTAMVQRLADRYARLITQTQDFDRCAVGGNCQSAAIATLVAAGLLRYGKQVDSLITLEATPPMPFPGRVAMLFGRESTTHNPFFKHPRPQDRWHAVYGRAEWIIVPGAHAEYFSEANLGALCRAVESILAAPLGPQPALPASGLSLVIASHPRHATTGTTLELTVRVESVAEGADPASLSVCARWSSESLGYWPMGGAEALPVLPIEAGQPAELAIPTPDRAGTWRLTLFLCREGAGPLAWAQDLASPLEIDVRDAPAAT